MIISHKHRFIFMHGQKTAGSTISLACNRSFGPRDELTGVWPNVIQNGGRFNARALGILSIALPRMLTSYTKYSILQRRPISGFWLKRMNKAIRQYYREKASFNGDPCHPPASQVRNYNERAFRDYFKFTVVRNPWDQAVSYYYWQTRQCPVASVSFKEFLLRFYDWERPDPERVRPKLKTNWEVYTINDQVVVDYVARFENLENELKTLEKKLNIPLLNGPSVKTKNRDRSKSLREHYDEETIDLVSRIYAKEIAYFDYRLPF